MELLKFFLCIGLLVAYAYGDEVAPEKEVFDIYEESRNFEKEYRLATSEFHMNSLAVEKAKDNVIAELDQLYGLSEKIENLQRKLIFKFHKREDVARATLRCLYDKNHSLIRAANELSKCINEYNRVYQVREEMNEIYLFAKKEINSLINQERICLHQTCPKLRSQIEVAVTNVLPKAIENLQRYSMSLEDHKLAIEGCYETVRTFYEPAHNLEHENNIFCVKKFVTLRWVTKPLFPGYAHIKKIYDFFFVKSAPASDTF